MILLTDRANCSNICCSVCCDFYFTFLFCFFYFVIRLFVALYVVTVCCLLVYLPFRNSYLLFDFRFGSLFVFLVYCLFDLLSCIYFLCCLYRPCGNVVAFLMFAGGRVSGVRVDRVWTRSNTLAVVTEALVVRVLLLVFTLIAPLLVVVAYS